MLNNYFKIEIPIINKNFFKFSEFEKTVKYQGKAVLIINKETKQLVFNTIILNENQEIFGTDNGKSGEYYIIKKYKELYNFRNDSFKFSVSLGRKKNISKFKNNIKTLNEYILKNKLTIKEVDAFITGSNSSGALSNPENDPVKIFYEKFDPLYNTFKKILKGNKNIWNFFSLISNIDNKQNNKTFSGEMTNSFINSIPTYNIEEIFNLNWNVKPYGTTEQEDLYIDFKKSFISQNINLFVNDNLEGELLLLPLSNWNSTNYIDIVIASLDLWDRNMISKQIRGIWKKIIEKEISNKKYKLDFIEGTKYFDKSHIYENNQALNIILNVNITINEKKKALNDLFLKDNYILLPKTIHNLWDTKVIKIKPNGQITNISLLNEEINSILPRRKNITSVYNDILTKDRIYLLSKRDDI